MKFVKMHGCGNDYVYFDCFERAILEPEKLAREISHRRFGVGADGLVMICPSSVADAKMRMFNADGSEGNMCGNAIRCVAKFLFGGGRVPKTEMAIETKSGVKTLTLRCQSEKVVFVRVNMGPANFSAKDVPVNLPAQEVVNFPQVFGGQEYKITCVSMGNPHCVVFCSDIGALDLQKIGPQFEHAKIFPQRVNTEFVRACGPREISMRVWERGSGETFACGTGACAAVAACVKTGLCAPGDEVLVHLRGGDLKITYTEGIIFMEGPAEKVFEGEWEV